MLKITNNTGSVVSVYNDTFNIEIAISETKIISDEYLSNCSEVYFKYFSLKKSEVESGWEKGISRYYYLYNKKINIPTVTKLILNGINEITLEKSDTNINVIIIKTMCVRGILLKTSGKTIKGQTVSFCDVKSRKKLMNIMLPKLIILFLLSVVLTLAAFIGEGTTEATIITLIVALMFFSWWLYTLRVFIKMKIYKEKQG